MKKNILVSINHYFMKFFLSMVQSLSDSNPNSEFDVYILQNNLPEEDRLFIKQTMPKNATPIFLDVDESYFKGMPKSKRWPHETFYRLMVAKLLPEDVDRILYLDGDIIIHGSIDELYNTDFENNLFVGCMQVNKFLNFFNCLRLTAFPKYKFVNAGVMLMNVKELRKELDLDKIGRFIRRNSWRLAMLDQDVLFKFFGNRMKVVDRYKYNLADRHITSYNKHHKKNKIDLAWVEKNNVIIHYLGRNKPWKPNYKGILAGFYKKYEVKIDNKN